MGWAKFDDQFSQHPKVLAAGPWAELLAMRAVIYAAGYETDGFIPTGALSRLGVGIPAAKKKAQALVDEGLWVESVGGWIIHDYLQYNPSRMERDTQRTFARRRWAMNNNPMLRQDIRKRDGDECRYCGLEVNWNDRKSPAGGTYDHVIPISRGGTDDLANIVVCCRDCNNRKGPRSPEEAGLTLLPPQITSKSNLDNSGHPDPVPLPVKATSARAEFVAFNAKRAVEAVRKRQRAGLPVKSPGGLARTIAADPEHVTESQRIWAHRECTTCKGRGFEELHSPGSGSVTVPCREPA